MQFIRFVRLLLAAVRSFPQRMDSLQFMIERLLASSAPAEDR